MLKLSKTAMNSTLTPLVTAELSLSADTTVTSALYGMANLKSWYIDVMYE